MVTDEKVNPFKRTIILSWILLWINIYHMVYYKQPYFDEVKLLYFMNTYQLLALFHMLGCMIWELSTILNIRVLSLRPLPPKEKSKGKIKS